MKNQRIENQNIIIPIGLSILWYFLLLFCARWRARGTRLHEPTTALVGHRIKVTQIRAQSGLWRTHLATGWPIILARSAVFPNKNQSRKKGHRWYWRTDEVRAMFLLLIFTVISLVLSEVAPLKPNFSLKKGFWYMKL